MATKTKPLAAGVGVAVVKDGNKILMGKRSKTKLYGMPGGYLERFETWEEGATRELKEETELDVDPNKVHIICVYNGLDKSNSFHNICIIALCELPEGQEAKIMEPKSSLGWEWWTLEEMENKVEELWYPNRQLVLEYRHLFEPDYMKKVLSSSPKNRNSYSV